MSGSRVLRLAILAGSVVLVLDLALDQRLSLIFDIGFVAVCLGAALAVRPRDFFVVGVLPPLLLLGFITVVGVVHRTWVADPGDGLVQAVVSGLAHRASGLLTAYLLVLAVLAMRQHVAAKRRAQARAASAEDLGEAAPGYENREASPAPSLATTGGPSERSTTVVGSEPHSPESITASNQ